MRLLLPAALCILGTTALAARPAAKHYAITPAATVLASPLDERSATFTADRRTVYFPVRIGDGYLQILCSSTLRNGRWSEPQVLPFSGGPAFDADPFITPDGHTLYFASNRSATAKPKPDLDIWVATFDGHIWSQPHPLPGKVNTAANERSPSLTASGRLYFSATKDGRNQIFYADRTPEGFSTPVLIPGAINNDGDNPSVAINPAEDTLVIASIGREDETLAPGESYPRGDLYLSHKTGNTWGPLRHLPAPINSTGADLSPSFSKDGKTLYFMSERNFASDQTVTLTYDTLTAGLSTPLNGRGNIYQIDTHALNICADSPQNCHLDRRPQAVAERPAVLLPPRPRPAESLSTLSSATADHIAHIFAPGIISTPGNEFSGAMTPDGNTIYFSRSVPRSYMYAIYLSHKINGVWSKPQLAPFSGHGRDFDPVISPNGQHMVFISDRPTQPGEQKHDYDIWTLDLQPNGQWSAPHHPGLPVNTSKPSSVRDFVNNEWSASVTNDGALYVASDGYEPGARMNLYRVPLLNGVYQQPENLGPIINGDGKSNDAGYANGEATLAPDGTFLIFASLARKGGFGGWDIYISRHLPNGTWDTPENLGPEVNTSARDYSPRIEPDGHTLIFTSEKNFTTGRTTPITFPEFKAGALGLLNGNGNLYEVDLCKLNLKSLRCAQ